MAFGVTRDPISGAIRANNAATGQNSYGATGSHTATTGAVDKTGYAERDAKKRARRQAIGRQFGTGAAQTPLGGGLI